MTTLSGRNSTELLDLAGSEMRGSFKNLKQRPNVKPIRTLAQRKKSNTSNNVTITAGSVIVAEGKSSIQSKGKSPTIPTTKSSIVISQPTSSRNRIEGAS